MKHNLTRVLVLVLMIGMLCLLFTGCDSSNYKKATELYEADQFEEALELFEKLGDYEDSAEMVNACNYGRANKLFEAGSYAEAKTLYASLDGYQDSADKVTECDYIEAKTALDSGDYAAAIPMLEALGDYEDTADLLNGARRSLMLEQYGDVFAMLSGHTWYCNGGSVNSMDGYTFTEDEVTVAHCFFDGNGKHYSETGTYSYSVDDKQITIESTDIVIAYENSDGKLVLGEPNEYFNEVEVEEALQGYWCCRSATYTLGQFFWTEHNLYIHDGQVTEEHAAPVYGKRDGSYYYYGPDTGSYTLSFGEIESDAYGSEWFFIVKDGQVLAMHYGNDAKPSDGLPGENGYKF